MERRILDVVTSIEVGMSIKKDLDALMMAARSCIMERCVVVGAFQSIDIGMSIKKDLDALMMAFP